MTMNERPIRWGFAGPGRMAANVARDWPNIRGGQLHAVASRDLGRAQAFADDHGFARAYGSLEAMLADPEVDAVYVATPHSVHSRDGIAVVNAGKALLMEKAFTATLAGAEALVAAARAREVFAMEAMWTRFQPAIVKVRDLISGGAVGEPRTVQADLGVAREYDPTDRLFDLGQGGGTILDLGVYVVNFAHMVLGAPEGVHVRGALGPSGVDVESAYLLDYGDGRSATLNASFRAPSPGYARVYGTKGWIDVPPRFHHPHSVTLHRHGGESEEFALPPRGIGYAHEFEEVHAALRAGRTESDVMPLSASLEVQAILQAAADQIEVNLHEVD